MGLERVTTREATVAALPEKWVREEINKIP